MNALNTILSSLNAQISALNSSNYKLYDENDKKYFLSAIEYDSDNDKLVFKCKEDKYEN